MHVRLPGYRFERRLRSSPTSEVWAGLRECDQLAVIAKVFAIEDREAGAGTQPSNQARVDHEFEMIRRLEMPGIVRALALERAGAHMILVLEAHRGIDLGEFFRRAPLSIDDFFSLALQISRILAEVHEQRVVHRDIKPTNILIDPESGEVVLADFGISQMLESERGRIHDLHVIEGTLPYMAPEQTGRTAREVDVRSDLYSLGVTFYEALTGQRPFTSESALELIHAHLARKPTPPQRLRPELPSALSDLVMKLLEKAPERRYQSARGLWRDLLALQTMLAAAELGAFELGRDDAPLSLALPRQLHGRELECAALQAAFRRTLVGKPELAIVVGGPGVGKSALVAELDEPVLGHRGFLIRGRFELGSDQPMLGLVTALSSLADHLLTEPPEQLARWCEQLRASLGALASVVVDLVPSFARVLGEQAPMQQRTPSEMRNQVMLAGVRLLRVFARPEHPVVLVLDDVQWADAATFDLLDSLLGEDQAALLIVLAGRESALEPGGLLATLLTKHEARVQQRSGGDALTRIELGPLGREPLIRLISDVLSRPTDQVAELAEIVGRKTGNNPFFVGQLLLHLAERQLLRRGSQGWSWDRAALEAAELPHDVLDMMTHKLEGQDEALRRLLQIASVIGGRFDARMLAQVARQDDAEVQLLRAVDEGLIAPLGSDYVFGHERIREAAYASIEPDEQARLHLAVGRQLLAGLDEAQRDLRVFEIVEHHARGYGLTAEGHGPPELEHRELLELARLNVRAGQRSLANGAPHSASVYLGVARRLLTRLGEVSAPPVPAEQFPARDHDLQPLWFASELASAQVEAMNKQTDQAAARLLELLARELTLEQRSVAACQQCWTLALAGRTEDAVRFGILMLREFGLAVPRWPTLRHVLVALPRMARSIRPQALERLRELEPIREPRILAALDIFGALAAATYAVSPFVFVVLVDCHAAAILRYGNHPSAPLVFCQVGLVVGNAFGRQQQALDVAQACRELAEGGAQRYRVVHTQTFIQQWSEPYPTLLGALDEVIESALERGDVVSAESAWLNHISFSLYGGRHLRLVQAQVERRIRWSETWGTTGIAGGGHEVHDACRLLIDGPAPEPGELDPLGVLAELARKPDNFLLLADFTVLSALVLAIYGRWSEVFALLDPLVARIERQLPRTWYIPISRALRGIAAAVLARTEAGGRRRSLLATLRADAQQAARWTKQVGNLAHVAALLHGELASLRGDLDAATSSFEQARALASAQQNPIYEALASERLAAAMLARSHASSALGPLLDARDHYQHWGAFAKVAALEQQWPELTARSSAHVRSSDPTTGSLSNSTTSRAIDSATMLKASQTLTDDIRLEEVITRVMSIALENAGAQRGVLVLADDGKLALAAESSAESGTLIHLDGLIPLARAGQKVAASILRWVERTGEAVVLADAVADHRFQADPYLRSGAGFSILCLPFVKHGRLVGLLYLENRLSAGSFVSERLEMLRLLSAHAASALENARLYADLRSSEVRWRSLVEQLPDQVLLFNRSGELEHVNLGAHVRGQTNAAHPDAREFGSPENRRLIDAALVRVLEHGAREQFELDATTTSGELRWVSVRLAPIVVDGRIERAILVATDISERKQAERAREQLESQLRQQQRLESIGTLASGVAHEINNPIQGIMNYAELIASCPGASEDVLEFAGEIEGETRRVTSIVRNLLAFSRQERAEASELVSPSKIVTDTLSLIRSVLRKDQIGLDVDVPDSLPSVRCRSQQIQQVIMNLVTNARDALNGKWAGAHVDKRIRIAGDTFEHAGKSWIRLSVEDRGGGIPDVVVARIFDPFFTTKVRDKGTGLGLSVSHGIVTDHGGRLVLDNRPGVGARFSIELQA